jgi:hypothetical protein
MIGGIGSYMQIVFKRMKKCGDVFRPASYDVEVFIRF